MSMPNRVPRCYHFADLTLETGQRQVCRNDVPLPLPKLSFATLLALVVNAPNVVAHDELAASVWGGSRVVTPENLAQRVMVLRRSLGDVSACPRYVKGVRGYGYGLIPNVTVTTAAPSGSRLATDLRDLPRPDAAARSSVAVLPFVRATTDLREIDFAHGLHEEVTQCLSRVATVKALPQASATTSADGARSITQLADTLVVDLIAKGNVKVSDRYVQAVAQLVDPVTCSPVWLRSYDRCIGDSLALQTEIARDLVRALSARLSNAENDAPLGKAADASRSSTCRERCRADLLACGS